MLALHWRQRLVAGHLSHAMEAVLDQVRPLVGYVAHAALYIAAFNAIVHGAIGIVLLQSPEKGKSMWPMLLTGRGYENPGSGIKYLACSGFLEMLAIFRYLMDDDRSAATRRIFAFQIFVLGGTSAFDQLTLAVPLQPYGALKHLLCFDTLNFVALVFHADTGMSVKEASKVVLGAKIAGFLWAAFVVRAVRGLGLGRFPREEAKSESDKE